MDKRQLTLGLVAGFLFEFLIYKIFFYSTSLIPFLFAIFLPLIIFLILRNKWNPFSKGLLLGAGLFIVVIIIMTFMAGASVIKLL